VAEGRTLFPRVKKRVATQQVFMNCARDVELWLAHQSTPAAPN
jgi:hypothetical protein